MIKPAPPSQTDPSQKANQQQGSHKQQQDKDSAAQSSLLKQVSQNQTSPRPKHKISQGSKAIAKASGLNKTKGTYQSLQASAIKRAE